MKKHLRFIRYMLTLLVCSTSVINIWSSTTEQVVAEDIAAILPESTAMQESVSSTPDKDSVDPKLAQALAQQKLNEEIEKFKKTVLKLAHDLDFAIETIAMHIETGSVVPTDKQGAFKNIVALRQLLQTTIREIMMTNELGMLTQCLKAIKKFQEHVETIVDNRVSEFPAFNVDLLITRSSAPMTVEDMVKEVEELKEDLAVINKEAEQAGIAVYNKVYRKTLGGLIDVVEKYHLDRKAIVVSTTATALIYFWYRLTRSDITPNDSPVWQERGTWNCIKNGYRYSYNTMRHYLGRYDISQYDWGNYGKIVIGYDGHQNPIYPSNFVDNVPNGPLVGIDSMINAYTTSALGLGSVFCGPKLAEMYRFHVRPFMHSATRKLYDAHCWLKGGIYRAQIKNKPHDNFRVNDPRFRFKDIVGYKDLKKMGYKLIEYVLDPEKFQRLNIVPDKGILLYGPPGTGKSHFAEALFGEIKEALKKSGRSTNEFRFYNIRLSDIKEMGIETILQIMQDNAPCVMFVDEIDLLGLQRDRNADRLYEFSTNLSGYLAEKDPKKQVIVIGATNKRENLDASILREGRLGKHVAVDLPTADTRYEYLIRALGNRINPDLFDLKEIALKTNGCTVEDLKKIVNAALFETRITGKPLTQRDLEDALNGEVRKIAVNQEAVLSEQEQCTLAIHMAGHALARVLLPTSEDLDTVTIHPVVEKPREQSVWSQYYKDQEPGQIYGKIFTRHSHDTLGVITQAAKANECKILLAGRMAEQLLTGTICCNNSRTCSGTCKPVAFKLAKEIVLNGLHESQMSKKMQDEINQKTAELIEKLEKEVATLLEQQKPYIMLISELLLQYKTISYKDIYHMVNVYMEEMKKNPELLKQLEAEQKRLAAEKEKLKDNAA